MKFKPAVIVIGTAVVTAGVLVAGLMVASNANASDVLWKNLMVTVNGATNSVLVNEQDLVNKKEWSYCSQVSGGAGQKSTGLSAMYGDLISVVAYTAGDCTSQAVNAKYQLLVTDDGQANFWVDVS